MTPVAAPARTHGIATSTHAPDDLTSTRSTLTAPANFAALTSDGEIIGWGAKQYSYKPATEAVKAIQIWTAGSSFAALLADGTVKCWTSASATYCNAKTACGVAAASTAPASITGAAELIPHQYGFAVRKTDGTVTAFGDNDPGWSLSSECAASRSLVPASHRVPLC